MLDNNGSEDGAIHVPAPGAVYPNDRFVYWQFSSSALANLATFTEGSNFELHATPLVDEHPRITGIISFTGTAESPKSGG